MEDFVSKWKSNKTCMFLIIRDEDDEKVGSISICHSLLAQLLAEEVHILLAAKHNNESIRKHRSKFHQAIRSK